MKLAKSLLLGSAAGLVAVAGAQAADLPVRAAAPVDYVRTCPNAPIGGTGFFVIPGTETCLRISGYVRAEYRFQETASTRANSDIDFFARGALNFDARTATEYGTLRSYIGLLADSEPTTGFRMTYANRGRIDVDRAFIQFGGLTAGRATSFFGFWGGNLYGPSNGAWNEGVELLAYTATFGSGFSATVSIENANTSRDAISVAGYGGQELPNLVANLRVDQAWGSAQISGALQQLRHGADGVAVDDEFGFAIGAGLNVKLPMIAAGDQIWLTAIYADGAIGYTDPATSVVEFTAVNFDANLNAGATALVNNTSWAVAAGFRHFFTPNVSTDLYGAFGAYDQGTNTVTDRSYTWWQAGANIGWTPVSGLLIGAEIDYTSIDLDTPVVVNGVNTDDGSVWAGRLRIQRSF